MQPSPLEKRLLDQVARASHDFGLLEAGDRVMVAVSGGKDSHALLHLLERIRRRAPFDFELFALNVDQGHPGFPKERLPDYFRREGYDFRVIEEDTYSVVTEKIPAGKTYCSLCSRLRRGILYTAAREMGATKIALGHHQDDLIETLLLNLFYAGQIRTMPPRLVSDDGTNVVIRPLVYSSETDLAAFAAEMEFPIIPCDLCGSQENLQRKRVKTLVATLTAENSNVRSNLFAALGNVRTSHLVQIAPRAPTGEASDHGEAMSLLGRSRAVR